MSRKAIVLVTASFVVGMMSTAALAASQQTNAAAQRDVAQLVRMMDKDHNGTVSKDEFLQFMGQVFDRIDADKNGSLDAKELMQTSLPRAVRRDCVHRTFPECSGS
jgi:Ca2+-binding EF-hand superfamily protein